jgi:hypothetical protein
MRKGFYFLWITLIALTSCKDNDVNVFDKTADERVSEAIASLKADLIAPPNGWKVKYKPTPESGSFYVLLNFKEDNQLIIRSDLAANNGKYLTDTLTYRIDNSLALELIFESYSFFSYLFEQQSATFEAEYEFNYVSKTPDNDLVFQSKTDASSVPTVLVFEEASATDEDLLGIDIANNLDAMSKDLNILSSSYKITYQSKDLILYASLDPLTRVIDISSASKKTNTATTANISFSAGYLVKGDSIIFDTPLSGTFVGSSASIKSIKLNALTSTEIDVCTDPIPAHSYTGITSANDAVTFETSLFSATGKQFVQASTFFLTYVDDIYQDGESVGDQVRSDVKGAVYMELYYNYTTSSGPLTAIGFYVVNADNTVSFLLREFTPTLTDNNIVFNFAPDVSVFGDPTDAVVDNVNIYLDALTEGDNTFVLKYSEGVFEFYNPCSGLDIVFVAAN